MYRKYLQMRDDKYTPWVAMCTVLSMQLSEYDSMTDKAKKYFYNDVDELVQKIVDNIQVKHDIITMITEAAKSGDDELLHVLFTSTFFGVVTEYLMKNIEVDDDEVMENIMSIFASPSLVKFLLTMTFNATNDNKDIIRTYLVYIKRFAVYGLKVLDNVKNVVESNEDDTLFLEAITEVIYEEDSDIEDILKKYY